MAKRNKGSSDLLYIKVKGNQIEQALKIFKQRVKENGLLLEIKEKSFYTKPSERRRTMKSIAKLRSKKDLDNIYKKFH